jgi:hypothetical protein
MLSTHGRTHATAHMHIHTAMENACLSSLLCLLSFVYNIRFLSVRYHGLPSQVDKQWDCTSPATIPTRTVGGWRRQLRFGGTIWERKWYAFMHERIFPRIRMMRYSGNPRSPSKGQLRVAQAGRNCRQSPLAIWFSVRILVFVKIQKKNTVLWICI